MARSGVTPKALQSKPESDEESRWILLGFGTLSSTRDWMMSGPLPLKLSEMLSWLDLHEVLDGDSRREFCLGCQALDAAWFDMRNKEAQENKVDEKATRRKR